MLPAVIHQYWDRPVPPSDVAERMKSWRTLHSGWDYRRWDDRSGGAFIADQFGAQAVRSFFAAVHPSMRADLLRTSLLLVFGGVYADADIKCREPIDNFVAGASTLIYTEKIVGAVSLANDFIAIEPGHPFIAKAWEAMVKNVGGSESWRSISQATGPV